MICPECNGSSFSQSTYEFDYSKNCGIEGVRIASVLRYECEKCENVLLSLGIMKEVDREIAKCIAATSGKMPGPQGRFIRTSLFGMSIDQFSEKSKIDATIIHATESNDLKYNDELSDIIRGLTVVELLQPRNPITVTLGEEKLEIRPKKKR